MVKFGVGEKVLIAAFAFYFLNKYFGFYFSFGVFVGGIIVQLLYWRQLTKVWKRLGVPGPPAKIYFGNIIELFTQGISVLDTKWTKEYGKVFGTYFFTQPELVVTDVELLKRILVKDFHNFTNRREVGDLSKQDSLFANILTILKDDEWKNVRNTITPAFTGGKMKNMTHLVDDCVETLLDILSENAARNEPFDVKERFGACAMDIIAATAFGTKINSQRDPNDLFVKYAKEMNLFSIKNISFIFAILFPWTTLQLQKRFNILILLRGVEEFFITSLTKLIQSRRQNPLTDKPDFLQLLLNTQGEAHEIGSRDTGKDDLISHDIGGRHIALTDKQIMSQSFLFLVAGYETTSVTLTWTTYLLAMNPEEQEKCYQEIRNAAGNEPITYNHIQHQMSYLDAVISETLRLFPPAVRFERNCKEEYNLDGTTIPKNATVTVAAYVIHHDPEYYPDPEVFMPERFLPEEKSKRNPLTYLPFGYGPRNCIGMRFAQMEMKLILANLIRKFKLVPCDKTEAYPPKLAKEGLMKPLKPIYLNVQLR